MEYDTSLADVAYSLASSWDSSRSLPREELVKKFSKSDISDFQTNQVIVFLETLAGEESFEKNQEAVKAMNEVYELLENRNPEIKVHFYDSVALSRQAYPVVCYSSDGSSSPSKLDSTPRKLPLSFAPLDASSMFDQSTEPSSRLSRIWPRRPSSNRSSSCTQLLAQWCHG